MARIGEVGWKVGRLRWMLIESGKGVLVLAVEEGVD